jgi:hypothetical protein
LSSFFRRCSSPMSVQRSHCARSDRSRVPGGRHQHQAPCCGHRYRRGPMTHWSRLPSGSPPPTCAWRIISRRQIHQPPRHSKSASKSVLLAEYQTGADSGRQRRGGGKGLGADRVGEGRGDESPPPKGGTLARVSQAFGGSETVPLFAKALIRKNSYSPSPPTVSSLSGLDT